MTNNVQDFVIIKPATTMATVCHFVKMETGDLRVNISAQNNAKVFPATYRMVHAFGDTM